nr:MAG TPA: hypothetical protein [Caudoviricetes sp.]
MIWKTYGTGKSIELSQVEATAHALEDAELLEHSSEWREAARRMLAAEIIMSELRTKAELELPDGTIIYLKRN